jgi:hypothetical protein
LINNSTWKYEAAGYTVTSNINGKSIFLPVTGRYDQYGLDYPRDGYYWTSSAGYIGDSFLSGVYMYFYSSQRHNVSTGNDFYGRAVRPVFTK